MVAHGRLPEITNDRFVDASRTGAGQIVGPLWRRPADRFGSIPLKNSPGKSTAMA
jgi:hypothetical protein